MRAGCGLHRLCPRDQREDAGEVDGQGVDFYFDSWCEVEIVTCNSTRMLKRGQHISFERAQQDTAEVTSKLRLQPLSNMKGQDMTSHKKMSNKQLGRIFHDSRAGQCHVHEKESSPAAQNLHPRVAGTARGPCGWHSDGSATPHSSPAALSACTVPPR